MNRDGLVNHGIITSFGTGQLKGRMMELNSVAQGS